jgi:protein AroM
MAHPLVGTLTIGQAPRPDVTPIIEAHLPHGTWCVHAGVLDGLTREEVVDKFGFHTGGRLLVTRMADGSSVRLDADRIEFGVRTGLSRLESRGCRVIVLLCTGVFRELHCDRAWLLEPNRVIGPVVSALLGARRVGVVVPEAQQIEHESFKWSGLAARPLFAAAGAYSDDLQPMRDAATTLKRAGAEGLVLDCIGFTERHRLAAAIASGLPVLLSNSIVARMTGELVASLAKE